MTESGKVEVVDIKFGNKTYENVSVKHLNPTDEGSHSHKRTSKELGVKKKKSKKTEMKEQKMTDKQQYDYLVYMRKYKPDIWRDLQGNKKVRKIMKKFESVNESLKLEELVGKPITEEQFDEAAGKKDACYRKVKARYDVWPSAYASGALVKCRKVGAANWGNKSKKEGVNETTKMKPQVKKLLKQKGYSPIFQAIDTSKRQFKQMRYSRGEIQDTLIDMFGDEDPKILQKIREGLGDKIAKRLKKHKGVNLKKKKIKLKGRGVYQDYDGLKEDVFFESTTENGMTTNHIYYEIDGKGYGYTLEFANDLNEAEYQGRKVKLGKIMQGDVKKFKVYVKNPKGNVVKVNFGQGGDAKGGTMRIRKSNPKARANFRARHNCDNPGPRHKARYWSCRKW